jgi:hypothetical protein
LSFFFILLLFIATLAIFAIKRAIVKLKK